MQVIALAAEHFTDQSLRHHVLHVLTRQLGPAQHLDTQDEAAPPGRGHCSKPAESCSLSMHDIKKRLLLQLAVCGILSRHFQVL